MENGIAVRQDGDREDRRDDEVKSRQTDTESFPPASVSHKRSLSNSLLSKFNFLRTANEVTGSSVEDYDPQDDDYMHGNGDSAMQWAQKSASKPRRRTGSLRKTAILGTGRARAEGRERRNTLTQRRPSATSKELDGSQEVILGRESDEISPSDAVLSLSSQRRFSYDKGDSADTPASISSEWSNPPSRQLSLDSNSTTSTLPPSSSITDFAQPSLLAVSAPIQSPTTSQSNASTTDEDDALSFSRPSLPTSLMKPASSSSSSSYFPSSAVESILRRRSTTTKKSPLSPLSALPMDYDAEVAEHSYSETEWWGWVVLVVTWIVFVVGMGSCLEVWSWAWDVGQTPYAPPELEDDPTLPIVGYYPALIILTAVMAWVWVVVAWVGMKYFKHAKIQGDDV